ncbi:prostacyclin receptor [Alosa sapidissima]|uniref:prostacyclin receptor n=1 Tax=Alosa sapidissima TaxID=34773 RepID=UPI001C092463|nr:prostacyclin receptor [Alosa sapidissima]XP_041919098.1 prostacyclin receptor [Alosa sapidissima]
MHSNQSCEKITSITVDGSPVVSTLMFIAGVVGNLMALGILGVHRKEHRAKSSVFCILVTGLAVTDLLGTCFLSPLVFVCYARSSSLLGLTGGSRHLCVLFAFAMTFFGLASMLILCAMAVERCLAISHPYFYSKHVRRSFAKLVLPLIYLVTCAFCLLPFFGYGQHKQYCPGTWCFIKMEVDGDGEGGLMDGDRHTLAFSLSYATLMALLVAAVFLCNGSVIISLCRMHRSQMSRRGSVLSAGRKRKIMVFGGQGDEEVEHLVLLASMTVIFVICSLPLTICGYVSAISPTGNDNLNLISFRFSALNPIVDPWIFILFRKAVFRHLRQLLRCRFPGNAVKATAHTALSLPLEVSEASAPIGAALQAKAYASLPQQ